MTVTRLQVKQLYKELLRYGCNLKLTDKDYYKSRIKQEFLDNKQLDNPDEINFFYNVSLKRILLKTLNLNTINPYNLLLEHFLKYLFLWHYFRNHDTSLFNTCNRDLSST